MEVGGLAAGRADAAVPLWRTDAAVFSGTRCPLIIKIL